MYYMKKQQEHLDNISEIRSIMERSSRFISLSGLSGVIAGVFGLTGAFYIWQFFDFKFYPYYDEVYNSLGKVRMDFLVTLTTVAAVVLLASLAFGIYFTTQKARKQSLPIWGNTSRRMLINLAIPLAAGGLFCFALVAHGLIYLIPSVTLIFYGLALLNASKYTLNDIRYLGVLEICIGLVTAALPMYSLLFWALGFGLLHIIYGTAMYYKYER